MRSLAIATLAFLSALCLALLPAASAQVPTPTMTVAISGLPAEFSGLASNATASADFSVDVTISNVVCPQAATIPVTITVTPASPPAFFSVAADPASVTINVPAGPHAQGTSGSASAKLVATLKEITANATVPVTVKADAAPPSGCSGAGTVPAASAEATINATMVMPPPPPAPTPEPAESPGPGALMGILAALVGATLWRRRG